MVTVPKDRQILFKYIIVLDNNTLSYSNYEQTSNSYKLQDIKTDQDIYNIIKNMN